MSYEYSPLPNPRYWVRLIRLDKEPYDPDRNPSLWCRIEQFQLDRAPPYKALSYEWGPKGPDNDASVFVRYRRLEIRKPLYKFLQRLAGDPSHDASEYFFADGICMNQEDNDEKDLQILLMGQLYTQATVVYSWIGVPSVQDSALLAALTKASSGMSRKLASRTIRAELLELQRALPGLRPIHAGTTLDVHNSEHLTFRLFVIRMLYDLVRRSYFVRLWMAQEMILAKGLQLYCGRYTFDWNQLEYWLPRRGVGGSHDCILDLFGAFPEDEGITYDVNGKMEIASWRVQPPWEKEWRELLHGRVGTIVQWRKTQDRRSLASAIERIWFQRMRASSRSSLGSPGSCHKAPL